MNNDDKDEVKKALTRIEAEVKAIEENGKAPREVRVLAVATSLLRTMVEDQEARLRRLEVVVDGLMGRR